MITQNMEMANLDIAGYPGACGVSGFQIAALSQVTKTYLQTYTSSRHALSALLVADLVKFDVSLV
jgi:hypothetical protein